jgi:hypothetical protein
MLNNYKKFGSRDKKILRVVREKKQIHFYALEKEFKGTITKGVLYSRVILLAAANLLDIDCGEVMVITPGSATLEA